MRLLSSGLVLVAAVFTAAYLFISFMQFAFAVITAYNQYIQ